MPRSVQICIFEGGGGVGGFQSNIPEILEWGHSWNFGPKILAIGMCSASQIVSHTLRVWRLISGTAVLQHLHSRIMTVFSYYNFSILPYFCQVDTNYGNF